MAPKEFKTTILEKSKIAEETYEIKLVRPKDFDYEAGQYIIIRIFSKMNDISLSSYAETNTYG